MKRHYFNLRIVWSGDYIVVSLMLKQKSQSNGDPSPFKDLTLGEERVKASGFWPELQHARIRAAQHSLIKEERRHRRERRLERLMTRQLNSRYGRRKEIK